jgi:hypothetical protein
MHQIVHLLSLPIGQDEAMHGAQWFESSKVMKVNENEICVQSDSLDVLGSIDQQEQGLSLALFCVPSNYN